MNLLERVKARDAVLRSGLCAICGSSTVGKDRCSSCGVLASALANRDSRVISAKGDRLRVGDVIGSAKGRVLNETIRVHDLPRGKRLLEMDCIVMMGGENKNGVDFPSQILKSAGPMGADRFGYFGHLDDDTWLAHKGMVVMDRVCCAWPGTPTWDPTIKSEDGRTVGGFRQKCVVWKDDVIDLVLALRDINMLHVFGPSTDLITDGESREENGRIKKKVSIIEGWTTSDLVAYPAAGGSVTLTRLLNSVISKHPRLSGLVRSLGATTQGEPPMAIPAGRTLATERRPVLPQRPVVPARPVVDEETALRRDINARKEDYGILATLAMENGIDETALQSVYEKRRAWKGKGNAPVAELTKMVEEVRDVNAAMPRGAVRQGKRQKDEGVQVGVITDFRDYAEKALYKMFDRTDDTREVSAFASLRQFAEAWYTHHGYNERVENSTLLDIMRGASLAAIPYNEMGNRLSYSGAFNETGRTANARMAAKSILLQNEINLKDKRAASALLDSDITSVTQSVMNKAALKFYVLAQQGGDPTVASPDRLISRKVSTTRFGDTHYFVRLQELDLAPTVAQGGAYATITNPQALQETASVSRKGYIIQITEQALANDDLGLVKLIPEAVGRGIGYTYYQDCFNILLNNNNVTSTGQALGSAAHSNNQTGTAISYTALRAMMRQMLRKKAYSVGAGGNKHFLATRLRQLLVSATIFPDAIELLTLETKPDTTDRGASALVNPKTPPIAVYPVPYWDETNTGLYWGTDDPKSGAVELLIALHYQGREEPEIFSQEQNEVGAMFTNDLWSIKGRHTYGFGIAGHEGFCRGTA